jgi:hypothetical protein
MGAVKLFTLSEANALIPWLERTMLSQRQRLERIAALARRISDLTGPAARPTLDPLDGDDARVRALKFELRADIRALRETSDTIEALGVCVTDMRVGSVDFPVIHEGANAWFCWSPGESRISFWHGDADCTAARRRITSDARMH